MKLRITFKTPDALTYALDDAPIPIVDGIQSEYREVAYLIASKWIKYGEQITVEIDLETKQITILEV